MYAEQSTIETIKDKADQLKDSAVKGTEEALDKADKLKNDAVKGTEQAKDAVSGVANTAKTGVVNAYNQSSQYVSNVITKIDTQKFRNGWDTATKFGPFVVYSG